MAKLLCQIDQSGAEALIVAYECRPGRYRDLFIYGINPHVYLGLAFYTHWEKEHPYIHEIRSLDIKDIPSHPMWKTLSKSIKDSDSNPPSRRYYYLYKQSNHSGNYDIKAPTFRLNLLLKSEGKVALSNRESELYLQTRNELFPEIKQWHKRVVDTLYKTRRLYNLQGFPREFTGFIEPGMYKEAYAHVPQSTVGCITNIAQINLQKYIEDENKDWDILNNRHDSYMAQAPKEEILDLVKKMKEYMEVDLTSSLGEKFKMKTEATVGYNWSKWSEKNPKGLKEIKL